MAQPAVKKSIYLDVCALCRSFDDQRCLRIRLETAAVELIMERVRSGDYCLSYSPAHRFEAEAFDDPHERGEIRDFLFRWGSKAEKYIVPGQPRERAEELTRAGFSSADAAHVAFADALSADFISFDNRLIRKYRKYGKGI